MHAGLTAQMAATWSMAVSAPDPVSVETSGAQFFWGGVYDKAQRIVIYLAGSGRRWGLPSTIWYKAIFMQMEIPNRFAFGGEVEQCLLVNSRRRLPAAERRERKEST